MSSQTATVVGAGSAGTVASQRQRRAWLLSGLSEGLPTLPGYVFELNGLLSATHVDLTQVSRVIRTDPSLSAQVLRLQQLIGGGAGHDIRPLEETVKLVGTERLRTLVMTTSLLEYTGKTLTVSDVQAFWQHCFLTALLSERIAQFTGAEDPEKAYLAGLLHDIGTLSLLVCPGTEERGATTVPTEGSADALVEERVQFGLDHCEMGRWIGVSWKFPLELIEVFEYHHEPTRATQNPGLVEIVAAADEICDLHGIGIGGAPPRLSQAGLERYQEVLQKHLPRLRPEDARKTGEELQATFLELFQMLEFTSSGIFGGAFPGNLV